MNDMSMQEIAGFLLSGEDVTEGVAETGSNVEIISVTDDATQIPVKRKRGRPSLAGGAMTTAERSRRYRERHRPTGAMRRVELLPGTVMRAEKIAEETGYSLEDVFSIALSLSKGNEFWLQHRRGVSTGA